MLIRSSVAAALAVLASLSVAVAAENVALNPQPEPPGRTHVSGIVLVALNPQPEPPGVAAPAFREHATTKTTVLPDRVGQVALNPQPEPPGVVAFDARVLLPPGPCRTVVVTIEIEGARAVTTHAVDTAERGRCAYHVATPGARAGSSAAVTFGRDKVR